MVLDLGGHALDTGGEAVGVPPGMISVVVTPGPFRPLVDQWNKRLERIGDEKVKGPARIARFAGRIVLLCRYTVGAVASGDPGWNSRASRA